MYIVASSAVLLVLLTSLINTLDVKSYSNKLSGRQRVPRVGATLKVALYPYIPDSAGDNFANLIRFIQQEFNKIRPDVNLQLRPINQNEDFYSMTTLTSWLSSSGTGFDVVEIDTGLLGDIINAGLIAPQFPISENHPDWHPTAAMAVQFNQAIYGYPHLMCAHFLFTRDEQAANATNIDQLINVLGPDTTSTYRLVGNMNSSWEMPAMWITSYINSNHSGFNSGAFAIHNYRSDSFQAMRKLAQLCERTGEENNCLNGIFRDNITMPSILFAHKQTAAMYGFSERLFYILTNGDPEDYSNIKMIPLPLGTTSNHRMLYTDAFVFRRNMSDDVLDAARSFVEFMGTSRMQAAFVGSGDSPNAKPRYLLPMSKNAYNEPLLANNRFYQQYFRNLNTAYPYPTAGFLNTRKQLQAAILKYINGNASKSSASIATSVHYNFSFLLFFIFCLHFIN